MVFDAFQLPPRRLRKRLGGCRRESQGLLFQSSGRQIPLLRTCVECRLHRHYGGRLHFHYGITSLVDGLVDEMAGLSSSGTSSDIFGNIFRDKGQEEQGHSGGGNAAERKRKKSQRHEYVLLRKRLPRDAHASGRHKRAS